MYLSLVRRIAGGLPVADLKFEWDAAKQHHGLNAGCADCRAIAVGTPHVVGYSVL
jgi:hypothetical protein